MTSNLNAMERQDNPIRAGWRLMKASKIMRDLLNYLTEKTCGAEDIVLWSNRNEDTLYYVFSSVSQNFMQEVILPWMWEWHRKNDRQTCGLPYADYINDNTIKLHIPLTKYEQDIVKPWRT